jgi:xanthine dehydrogenase YagT iron-sulfur-binding subunit
MTNDPADMSSHPTRREIIASGAMVPVAMGLPSGAAAQSSTGAAMPEAVSVSLSVNGTRHALTLDPRTTLLEPAA